MRMSEFKRAQRRRHLMVAFIVVEIGLVAYYAYITMTGDHDSVFPRMGVNYEDMDFSAEQWDDDDLTDRERLLRGMESHSTQFLELDERE